MEQSAILKAYEQKEPLTPAAIQLILETRSLHKRKVKCISAPSLNFLWLLLPLDPVYSFQISFPDALKLQMRSPEVDNEGYASGGNKGFDDIYLI